MPLGIISHQNCLLHDMGKSHPESPARLKAIFQHIENSALKHQLVQFEAQSIEQNLLTLAHTQQYVEFIFENAPKKGVFQLDPDTLMTPHTLSAALFSAGAAVQAVDLVMQNKLSSVFCATRPPGHHAEKDRAMGFCLFNNVAIAAAYALKHYQLDKVAILDFDVHHGNGTQNIFAGNSQVLFCSTFQHPFYPFSGTENHAANIINTPLPAHTDSQMFQQAVTTHWLPVLRQFAPQMILISAGFDAHAEDNMSQTQLFDSDYLWVTQQIKCIADIYCAGRIVSVLEGGYALEALGRSVVAHLQGMLDR